MKKILIISSSNNLAPILPLFDEISSQGMPYLLLVAPRALKETDRDKTIITKKLTFLPAEPGIIASIGLVVILPALCLFYAIKIWLLKKKYRIDALFCLGWWDRIIFTPIGKMLKLRVLWIILPEEKYARINRPTLGLARRFSSWARLVCFDHETVKHLGKAGFSRQNIDITHYGIKPGRLLHQKNIFTQLAETEKRNTRKKFFTAGTVVDLDGKQNFEVIFQAVKISIQVIPNLQLIIMGEGEELKNLKWLAKQMEIDTLVWFVGRQNIMAKWLDNLDFYLVSSRQINLRDIYFALCAAGAGLPIVHPAHTALSDYFVENSSAVFGLDDSESLAQEIIKLQQNHKRHKELAIKGQGLVQNRYRLESTASQIINLIN